jgi:thiamine-monophosphate kinase
VVEDVHFTRPGFSYEDIGHKALAVNLSDLASMGAKPAWFVCALELPKPLPRASLLAMAHGMSALAQAHGIALVGGNLTSAKQLAITITAAGEVTGGRALERQGRPGDLLYVSGTLGEARLGLKLLTRGGGPKALTLRQRRPVPRLALGLLARRFARGAIDVSDGLAQDLGHLCAASGLGATVELSRVPVAPAVRAHARSEKEALDWALGGGEDYELLLAVPKASAAAFERSCGRAGEQVTCIGELTGAQGLKLRAASGATVAPPPGFNHFGG